VKKVLCVIFAATLVAALIPMATAQDAKVLPPSHLYGSGASIKLPNIVHPTHNRASDPVFFCLKRNCLEYGGDNDTTSSQNNGLFDFENPGIGITDAQVWQPYIVKKGTGKTTATGMAGNYYTNTTAIGTNPTPTQFRTGISEGVTGKPLCPGTTSGTAVMAAYGSPNFGLNSFNYWVKKMNKSCVHKQGKRAKTEFYWIGPQYNDGSTIGYLEDNDGLMANKRVNKQWKAVQTGGFFNSSSFGTVMKNTLGSSGACGGIGCAGFSTSVNGK
jgi:hypothetical protein